MYLVFGCLEVEIFIIQDKPRYLYDMNPTTVLSQSMKCATIEVLFVY